MKRLVMLSTLVLACGPSDLGVDAGRDASRTDAEGDSAMPDVFDGFDAADAAIVDERGLPLRHVHDPMRAAQGEAFLQRATGASLPWMAWTSLWVVWLRPGLDDEAYWAEFSRRYGFVPRESGPPFGIVQNGSQGSIQCMACHTDHVAGEDLIGAGNGRLDLERLYDDLVALREQALMFGVVVPPVPDIWHDAFQGRTGAPGANDAFGMGMTLAAARGGGDVETRFGFQQPAAWWQLAFKDRIYADGAGTSENFRTMMATSLASDASLAELMALEEDFEDLRHFMLSLRPPPWPFAEPEPSRVAAGEVLFNEACASCHGTYGPGGSYPDRIVDVGTDALRHQRFGEAEASWLNSGWFGQPPLMDTDGYLAPPLLGVWATAPYFHNGSVPDLRAVLLPSERPPAWCRSDEPYDESRLGIAHAEGSCFDTTAEGLSAEGHDFAAALSEDDVSALLAYLSTL